MNAALVEKLEGLRRALGEASDPAVKELEAAMDACLKAVAHVEKAAKLNQSIKARMGAPYFLGVAEKLEGVVSTLKAEIRLLRGRR